MSLHRGTSCIDESQVHCVLPLCCAMDQAVNRQPLTAEARDRFQFSLCEGYGGKSGTGTDFCPRTLVSLPVSFHQCSILVFIYMLRLPEEEKGES